MKGFEEIEKETYTETEQNVVKQPEIVQHSKQSKKGGFMERIFSGASKFFDEDVEGSSK
jgi:hypothetical protein